MRSDWYTLLSLGMRYWFALLSVIIVFRAWRITVRDSRRAKTLRAWAPDTGAIGEIIVVAGSGSLRKGTRVPIPREGLMGSSRKADVRLKHPDVRRYHAHLEQREEGILASPIGKAEMLLSGRTGEKLLIRDGDQFSIGALKLMMVLYDPAQSADIRLEEMEDDIFSPAGVGVQNTVKRPRKTRPIVETPATKPRNRNRKAEKVEFFMPFDDAPPASKQDIPRKKKAKGKNKTEEVEWWQDEKKWKRKS